MATVHAHTARPNSRLRGAWLGLLLLIIASTCVAGLRLERRIDLPATQGRLDHLAVDLEHRRLYAAALGSDAVEVIDLEISKRSARLEGLREPQGLAYLPATGRLFVANGKGNSVEAFMDGRRETVAEGLPDADNLRFDEQAHRLYLGFGRALAALDPEGLRLLQLMTLPGHPEGFSLAIGSPRVYVNVPSAAAIAVLDRRNGAELARWSVAPASRNFPMALDEPGKRLYVATRQPGALQAYDTTSGKRVAELPLCGDADDLFFDAERRQLYAVCGEGVVAVVRWRDADRGAVVQRLPSSPGARTGLFVPSLSTLFVAAPAKARQPAQILVYRVD